MSAPAPGGAFVPLMLRPGWILERDLGWRVLEEGPALKVIARRHGPVRTLLLMAHGAGAAAVDDAARRHGAVGPLTLATLADFHAPAGGVAAGTRDVAGRAFARVERGRFFGVGTFVVDLAEDEATLWSRISSGKRKEARHLERAGVRVECRPPGDADLDEFLRLYAPMARRKRLDPASPGALGAMAARGALLLCRASDAEGSVLVANLLYVDHGQGYFLYSARAEHGPAGAAMLAQWEGLRALKARGCRFYDLGLVASTDDSDGLYRFKRALGGRFVSYGEEYRRTPAWLRLPYAAFQRWRRR